MNNYLETYLKDVQADGKLYFTLDEIKKKFDLKSEEALKLSLNRLSKKDRIVSVNKGFYVIITPEYSIQKILPPELFIDDLFKYLRKPYYVGLLSAAFYHGASHQQPQEYFVIIDKPAMRSTNIEGLKINYIVDSNINTKGLDEKKTNAGFMKISNAEQTAVDLIKFQDRIGGLSRASTVIYELVESINAEKLKSVITSCIQNTVLQRLGYIMENIIHNNELAEVIYNVLKEREIFRTALNPAISNTGFKTNPKWQIVENTKIETDIE